MKTVTFRRRLILAAVFFAPLLALSLVSPSLVKRGRLAGDEPYLQVVGHYVPLPPQPRVLTIGSGEASDILLTEPNVDELHGWLAPLESGAWKYVHHSASMPAEGPGLSTDQTFIDEGESIILQPAALGAPSCPSTENRLTVRNATAVLLSEGSADAGLLLLRDGEFFPLLASGPPMYLASCSGRVGLTAGQDCQHQFRSVETIARNMMATFGTPSPIDRHLSTLLPASDTRLEQLRGVRVGVPLFAHRYAAFIATDGKTYRPVQPTDSAAVQPGTEAFSITTPSSSVPVLLDGRWFSLHARRKLLLRRAGGIAQSVWQCSASEKPPQLVGELPRLTTGSRWILGATQYRLALPAQNLGPQILALLPVERSDRAHYFLSLSAGRLNAFGARQPVPFCGQGRVRLLGRSSNGLGAPPEGNDDASTRTMQVRPPGWAAAAHPRVAREHASEVDLGYVCVNAAGLLLTPPTTTLPLQGGSLSAVRPVGMNGQPFTTLPPGARFQVAGQLVEFCLGTPRYEQVVPLLGLAMFLGIAGVGAIVILDRGLGGALKRRTPTVFGSDDFLELTAAIIVLMTALMTCGAMLLMRMAASDRLIGKPDYVHRQLFFLSLGAILFVAILAAAVGDASLSAEATLAERVVARLRSGVAVFVCGGLLLILWIFADAIGWIFAAKDWMAASDLSRGTMVRWWWQSFPLPHGTPFAVALALLVFLVVAERLLVRNATRIGLDRAWRLAVGSRGRQIVAVVVSLALLTVAGIYAVLCRPSWVTIVAWLALGALVAPTVAPAMTGGGFRRPANKRLAVIAAVLLISAGRAPRDGLDVIELLFFLLLSMAVALGIALAIGLITSSIGSRWGIARRLGIEFPATPVREYYVEHHVQLLTIGFLALAAGLVLQSHRSILGLKPAEFAVWFLGSGLAMFLATRWDLVQTRLVVKPLSRLHFIVRLLPLFLVAIGCGALLFLPGFRLLSLSLFTIALPFAIYLLPQTGWKNPARGVRLLRLRTPITTLFLLLSIELAVLLLYGAEGDFGPLLVLVPALLFTVVYWVVTPERSAAQAGSRRVLERLGILTVLISASIGLAMAGYVLVTSERVQNLPFIGTSIHRAADRLITFSDDWYTSSGSWSVTANWIAADLTNERYLSNLHSDLALIAFRQSFGVRSTYVIVLLYLGIALLLGFLAASFHHSHSTLLSDAHDADAVTTRKSVLVASLTLWFATFYLLMEVVIHCLTNFNYIPQTGLVLPWVSSGGSAAIAFSGLLALVLAMAAQVYKRIAARERGQRHA